MIVTNTHTNCELNALVDTGLNCITLKPLNRELYGINDYFMYKLNSLDVVHLGLVGGNGCLKFNVL